MSDNTKREEDLLSEIINNKKQLILKVDQTSDYVYPNELFKYEIYCKNVSGSTIENLHIQIINPSSVAIQEDLYETGLELENLDDGQSHLIYVPARCSTEGEFTVHFLCYGDDTGLFIKSLTISCSYNSYNAETIHKIHIYNFSPYEDTYELHSKNYSDSVTQLIKKQKLPYGVGQNPFKIEFNDNDESNYYLKQYDILYGDKHNIPYDNKNTDEHSYQYIERENFNKESIESYEGENLREIFNEINKKSKFFNGVFLKTGTNELFNDFREYNPDGFIYRFGLMRSEIFHHIGVIPDFSYMNDYLFRWAAEGSLPLNLYPKRVDMNWNLNKWAGRGWNVWKVYSEEYKKQIINQESYKPFHKFIHTFDDLNTAEEYIKNEYLYDNSNAYYINTEKGIEKIKKYNFIIKESYFDTGVFFVHIPLSKIPSNFFLLDTQEIEAIIERTKPYGMKALIKYVIDAQFNLNMSMKSYIKMCPQTKFNIDFEKLKYNSTPYKYTNVIETICHKIDENQFTYEDREMVKLVPNGTAYSNEFFINMDPVLEYKKAEPTSASNISLNPYISQNTYKCQNDMNLLYFSDIFDLLYQSNFETISFLLKNISTYPIQKITETTSQQEIIDMSNFKISAVDYQLWIDSLKKNDPHSHWWEVNIDDHNQYFLTDNNSNTHLIDFFEIPLVTYQLTQKGIESGIGFEDGLGKLHGISAEYNENYNSFVVKYATSMNQNFKIQKQGISDLVGLAFKFIYTNKNTLVVFFIKKIENNEIKYYYFDHIILNKIKQLFCFIRNGKDISAIRKWSNLIRVGKITNAKITFNTPQYNNFEIYDPNIIQVQDENWQNITRIDRNEHSYALAHNLTEDEIEMKDIQLHFDNIKIPDDAIVKNIKLKTTIESNSYKSMYPSIRLQDGFITENSMINNIACHPEDIIAYPQYNNDTEYYQEQYDIAAENNIQKSMNLFKSKIEENEIFNDSLNYSTEYLNDIDDYITIKKPYWVELSNFSDYNISMNDISSIKFCIEGYNHGEEIYLTSQLKQNNLRSEKEDILIEKGYFKKYIPLKYYNKFFISDVKLRFRFKNLNNQVKVFDTYVDITFNSKKNERKEFTDITTVDIEKKKIIDTTLVNEEIPGYIIKNGLTVNLGFDNLDVGEYYRIYAIELDVVYQKQNTSFTINSEKQSNFVIVNGQNINSYMSGKFFNEIIMPGAYQELSTANTENQGIELEDSLYQSFIATSNNITSITLYPNGFIGNPDLNLKIGLYENKGNTPNIKIKEIRVNGWSKANSKLKNLSAITYDFNISDLTIGKKYWLKIEVDNPSENNYYLLKYIDSVQNGLKLLVKKNNNFINTFGTLKFHINTLNSFRSFNSLPASEDREDYCNGKILISLNKRIGEIKNLKVQRV